MAMMGSSGWTGQDHQLHAGHDDDFQQFLDMGGMGNLPESINFDFNDFQNANGAHMPMQAPPREHLDTPMSGADTPVMMSGTDNVLQHQMAAMTTAQSYQSIPTGMIPPPTPNEALVNNIDAQIHYLQQQKMEHQRAMEEQAFFARQQQSRIIPPTPQSLELQAGNQQYYSQPTMADHTPQHQAVNYRFQRIKDQQEMSFTPLVSPAVTPLESHFPVDSQFTVPGAYFSPLTSPALHAQTDPLAGFDQRHGPVHMSSPGEMDLEMPAPGLSSTPGDFAKKSSKKNTPKSRPKSNVRQSPISKPQRRKTTTTPHLAAQVLTELVESGDINKDGPVHKALAASRTSASSTTGATDSENGSVSPEALNNPSPAEMPPPPVPKSRSARPSPYIAPQNDKPGTPSFKPRPGAVSPATPASLLMKTSSPSNRTPSARHGDHDMDEVIENLELPESATNFPKPNLAPINTQVLKQGQPEVTSSKTPNLQPLPSPGFAKPTTAASASQSPNLGPGSTGLRKTPQLLPRGSKKRTSISSVHVSPALRPKISPSIKPLLPGGATAEDTASHLLATKSNYQRILEGSTVGGVSYPSELSTNLTSKRTSHKIAEQGRRNRINSALQEIATLLPKQPHKDSSEGEGADKKDKDKDKDKDKSTPNSKASTVEMAIEYIKQLQQDLKDANERAEEAERKLKLHSADAEKVE